MADKYLTVSQLTKYVARKFDQDPYLETVYLTGEISNISRNNPKGHQYFTLKDEDAQISVVMFRYAFQKIKFQPKDGDKVLVVGRVTVYQPRGNYQLIIEHMEPDGIGQLYRLFEERREKLSKEGLFDLPKKKIPRFPKRIGIITSSSGAVIHDIMLNVQKRYPLVELVLYPTIVQGSEAGRSIAENIKKADQTKSFDVLIVGRGGGSFEDLFAFNEEEVIRAIAEASTPIISSVGHETDTTLADLAADYRASTPTEAAVIATPVLQEEILNIQNLTSRMNKTYRQFLLQQFERLERSEKSYIFKQPERLYEQSSQTLDLAEKELHRNTQTYLQDLTLRLEKFDYQMKSFRPEDLISEAQEQTARTVQGLHRQFKFYLNMKEHQTSQLISSLDLLSPLGTLARGYNFTIREDQIIKSAHELEKDDQITIQFHDGKVKAKVETINEQNKGE
ncbi:MAG: exodeoxyribonuclease VII large subunit [Atopococcus tabaci]|uniref:Exodeoxyribonuclease 7 large subunit n=1 Tax=Atopococcus tabaci TaxID=269774 RepID=A0AA43RK28_9LACT|nr:exodeoxyribonuclease VII large subunit [Atopococcus tabaci]